MFTYLVLLAIWQHHTDNWRLTSKLKLSPISNDWLAILKLLVCRCICQKTKKPTHLYELLEYKNGVCI